MMGRIACGGLRPDLNQAPAESFVVQLQEMAGQAQSSVDVSAVLDGYLWHVAPSRGCGRSVSAR